MLHLSGNHWGAFGTESRSLFGVEGAGCFFFFFLCLAVKIDSLPDPNNLGYGLAAVTETLRETVAGGELLEPWLRVLRFTRAPFR